jgi:hypothetical protein
VPKLVVTLTMRPHPWRIISATTAFVRANGAVVWTASKRRRCSALSVSRCAAVRPPAKEHNVETNVGSCMVNPREIHIADADEASTGVIDSVDARTKLERSALPQG